MTSKYNLMRKALTDKFSGKINEEQCKKIIKRVKNGNSRYDEYINSDEWKEKREQCFTQKGRMCQKCGTTKYLQVHHSHYAGLGKEKLKSLFILCKDCHKLFHDTYGTKRDLVVETREFLGLPLKKEIIIPEGLVTYIRQGGKFRKNPFTKSLKVWKKAKKL